MNELVTFMQLGVGHVLDIEALDHLLFLLVLAAAFRPREWRAGVLVLTSFTVGHSVTLALAVTGALQLPTPVIEFLIPVTIVAAAAANLRPTRGDAVRAWARPLLAGAFGLVHGAGFANGLRELLPGRVAVPLIGFNVGIELGQLTALAAIIPLLAATDWLFVRLGGYGLRARVVAVSGVAALFAVRMAVERYPW